MSEDQVQTLFDITASCVSNNLGHFSKRSIAGNYKLYQVLRTVIFLQGVSLVITCLFHSNTGHKKKQPLKLKSKSKKAVERYHEKM